MLLSYVDDLVSVLLVLWLQNKLVMNIYSVTTSQSSIRYLPDCKRLNVHIFKTLDYLNIQFQCHWSEQIRLPSDLPYELLYGKVGFLWSCSFLNKHIGEGTVSNSTMVCLNKYLVSVFMNRSFSFIVNTLSCLDFDALISMKLSSEGNFCGHYKSWKKFRKGKMPVNV